MTLPEEPMDEWTPEQIEEILEQSAQDARAGRIRVVEIPEELRFNADDLESFEVGTHTERAKRLMEFYRRLPRKRVDTRLYDEDAARAGREMLEKYETK